MKIDDILELKIEKLGINGEGISFNERKTIFVDNAIPGEIVSVKIIDIKDKLIYAKLLKIIKESPFRVKPFCKYYDRCGGCQIQHIDYCKGLDYKRDILLESLKRYSGLNYHTFEIRKMIESNKDHYRNKSQLPYNKKNNNLCLYQKDSNKLIDIDKCPIQNEIINTVNNEILKVINKYNLNEYINYVVSRVVYNNEVQVTLIINKDLDLSYISKDILNIENVKSFYTDYNKDGIFNNKLKYISGKKVLTDKLENIKYNLLPNSFFQLNPNQAINLYNIVKKVAKLSNTEIILDAFCGVGSISLWLAKNCLKVVGIDNNKEAIINANENKKLNKINNVEFICGDVSTVINTNYKDTKFDIIVCDPPRVGLQNFVYDILKIKPKRFIYVSCNPSTLAKDLKILSSLYKVNLITPVDMFPQTSHVETVALLTLNPSVKK